LNNQTSMQRNS